MKRCAKATAVVLILVLCCPAGVRCVEYADLPGLDRRSLPPRNPQVVYTRDFPAYVPESPAGAFQLIPTTWDAQAMLIPTRWDANIVLLGTASAQRSVGWEQRASERFITRAAPNITTKEGVSALPLGPFPPYGSLMTVRAVGEAPSDRRAERTFTPGETQ